MDRSLRGEGWGLKESRDGTAEAAQEQGGRLEGVWWERGRRQDGRLQGGRLKVWRGAKLRAQRKRAGAAQEAGRLKGGRLGVGSVDQGVGVCGSRNRAAVLHERVKKPFLCLLCLASLNSIKTAASLCLAHLPPHPTCIPLQLVSC